MAKREFVQLAHKLDTAKLRQHIGGWFWSEKLDGERCFWDGGVSRGILKSEIPWANCTKDARYQALQVSTGLWSRYGNVIHAPDWFLDASPKCMCDGELWSLDKTARQFIHSWIKKIVPMEDEWRKVTYMVFDSPPPITIFADGIIDNVNFKKVFKGCREYWYQSKVAMDWIANPATIYKSSQAMIAPIIAKCDQQIVRLHEQHELPFAQHLALKVLENNLSTVVDNGGEGLIVRDPNKCYECCRSHFLLKMKPFDDMEGTVIGYTTGRETDKGSRLLGKMGALIVRLPNGSRLELSGFTDQERELGCIDSQPVNRAKFWANNNPEAEVPDWIQAEMFPRGTVVTFKYRGLSADGIPIEARYWRKR